MIHFFLESLHTFATHGVLSSTEMTHLMAILEIELFFHNFLIEMSVCDTYMKPVKSQGARI